MPHNGIHAFITVVLLIPLKMLNTKTEKANGIPISPRLGHQLLECRNKVSFDKNTGYRIDQVTLILRNLR